VAGPGLELQTYSKREAMNDMERDVSVIKFLLTVIVVVYLCFGLPQHAQDEIRSSFWWFPIFMWIIGGITVLVVVLAWLFDPVGTPQLWFEALSGDSSRMKWMIDSAVRDKFWSDEYVKVHPYLECLVKKAVNISNTARDAHIDLLQEMRKECERNPSPETWLAWGLAIGKGIEKGYDQQREEAVYRGTSEAANDWCDERRVWAESIVDKHRRYEDRWPFDRQHLSALLDIEEEKRTAHNQKLGEARRNYKKHPSDENWLKWVEVINLGIKTGKPSYNQPEEEKLFRAEKSADWVCGTGLALGEFLKKGKGND
jgi:hypothetical protein